MSLFPFRAAIGLAFAGLLLPAGAHAIPIAFTDPAGFDAAVAGLVGVTSQTLGLDDEGAGTVIPNGGAAGGITWSYPASVER